MSAIATLVDTLGQIQATQVSDDGRVNLECFLQSEDSNIKDLMRNFADASLKVVGPLVAAQLYKTRWAIAWICGFKGSRPMWSGSGGACTSAAASGN